MTDIFLLTRQLVDIESVTNNEAPVGEFLLEALSRLAGRFSGHVERCPVKADRFNVFAHWGEPLVTLSTHMDTVPPFFASREDADFIWGRGSADAKGIIASMIGAAEGLLERGVRNFGLLFVVGEERNSAGAYAAASDPRGSKFLINGEPTENHVATASKGTLRVEITAGGRMAHSAYPQLGESAIDKLLEALRRLQAIKLPIDPELGPCTVNIGVIEGGRAPNVIPDHARAQLLYRLIGPSDELKRQIQNAVAGLATAEFVLEIPFVRLRSVDGLPTMVAAYTTDIPWLSNWGQPLLLGPGSIHVAHTDREHIEKKQLHQAVDLYASVVRKLVG